MHKPSFLLLPQLGAPSVSLPLLRQSREATGLEDGVYDAVHQIGFVAKCLRTIMTFGKQWGYRPTSPSMAEGKFWEVMLWRATDAARDPIKAARLAPRASTSMTFPSVDIFCVEVCA